MIEQFAKIFREQNGRDPTEEEVGKAMEMQATLEKDRVRKSLHGTAKNITAENKFKLLKNNGSRDK